MLHFRYSVSSRIDSETGEFLEWQETPAEEYEEKEIFEILDEERTEADASSAPVSDSIANVHIGETEIIIKFLRF